MSDKDHEQLAQMLAASDAWLLKYGITSPVMHNTVVMSIYLNFPKVKYVEYFLDLENRKIDVTVYLGFWNMLFTNKDKLINSIIDTITDYLHDYNATVRVKRLTREVKI